jgi:hypothetical protein
MSVLRQLNILGQQRLDVPHLRSVESSITADFDVMAGRMQAGSKAVVIRGFTLANYSAGTAASSIQLSTADGIVYNINASEAGTFLWVPSDRPIEVLNSITNARVDGSFTAGQVNYIGIDFRRDADDTTSDLVQFLDANTLLENAKNVPLGRTLDYRIVISTTPFSAASNIVPIAKVKTDSQNQVDSAVTAVEDARNLMFRLASGGDFPNRYNAFSYPRSRTEQDPLVASQSALDKFSGGDKDITSQKDWQDSIMSRLWELGGGQHWYSPTADRNVKMVGAPSPAVFTSTSDNFEWGIEAGIPALGLYGVNHLHWQGLKFLFDNSDVTGVYYNAVSDQISDDAAGSALLSKTALAVGECIYVDLDRTTNATVVAKKVTIQGLGTPTIPGSRVIIAWRTAEGTFRRDSVNPINTSYPVATIGSPGSVRLAYVAGHPATPTVAPLNSVNGMSIGALAGLYPISGNNVGLTVVGGGTGAGINTTGGSGGFSIGIIASGGPTSGSGGVFIATGGQFGIQGTSDTGTGVYGSSGVSGFSPSGVFGQGNGATSRGVSGSGWQPGGASVSADGGLAGSFFGGPGSDFTMALSRAGGRGVEVFGGNGSATNSGGAGADAVFAMGGFGGTAQTGSGSGGIGGRAGYFEGGAGGGTTSPFAPAAGGAGIVAVGGSGGLQNPSFLVSGAGGAGAIITGGVGGNLGAGTGAIITGGAGSTFGGASGGVGASITGGAHSSIVGTALVVTGVAPGTSGNGGTAIFTTGGNGTGGSLGGNAITAVGGNAGGGGNQGGYGGRFTGGNGGGGAGNGGHGVRGLGGNGSGGIYNGGHGGYFEGGTGTNANGYGLYSLGGAGNYGAFIEGGATNGSGAFIQPGSGNGHGLIIGNVNGAGNGLHISSIGGTGNAINVTGGASLPAIRATGVSGNPAAHFTSSALNIPVLEVNGYIDFDDAVNPSPSTTFNNILTPSNIVKAWGHCSWSNGAPTLATGFNVVSITSPSPTTGTIDFTFGGSQIGFACIVGTAGFAPYIFSATGIANRMQISDAAGTGVNFNVTSGRFFFIAMFEQTP